MGMEIGEAGHDVGAGNGGSQYQILVRGVGDHQGCGGHLVRRQLEGCDGLTGRRQLLAAGVSDHPTARRLDLHARETGALQISGPATFDGRAPVH